MDFGSYTYSVEGDKVEIPLVCDIEHGISWYLLQDLDEDEQPIFIKCKKYSKANHLKELEQEFAENNLKLLEYGKAQIVDNRYFILPNKFLRYFHEKSIVDTMVWILFGEFSIELWLESDLSKNLDALEFEDSLMAVVDENYIHGCVNHKGEMILPFDYQDVEVLSEEVIAATQFADGIKIFDRYGNELLSGQFREAYIISDNWIELTDMEYNTSYLSKDGKLVTNYIEDSDE